MIKFQQGISNFFSRAQTLATACHCTRLSPRKKILNSLLKLYYFHSKRHSLSEFSTASYTDGIRILQKCSEPNENLYSRYIWPPEHNGAFRFRLRPFSSKPRPLSVQKQTFFPEKLSMSTLRESIEDTFRSIFTVQTNFLALLLHPEMFRFLWKFSIFWFAPKIFQLSHAR